MERIINAWAAWGRFWTNASVGAQPNNDMRATRVVRRILNIQA